MTIHEHIVRALASERVNDLLRAAAADRPVAELRETRSPSASATKSPEAGRSARQRFRVAEADER
jgi:hypothetical protein